MFLCICLSAAVRAEGDISFGTFTVFSTQANFSTMTAGDPSHKTFDPRNVLLAAESYWRFRGTLKPDLSAYVQVKVIDDTATNLWRKNDSGSVSENWNTSLPSLGAGLLFYPFNYLNGKNPDIGHLRLGVDTRWINWETGYGRAKSTAHSFIIWETVGNDWNANRGYAKFSPGTALTQAGPVRITAAFAPNMSLGAFGLYSWFGVSLNGFRAEIQYDFKSAEKSDPVKMFDRLEQQDFVFGAVFPNKSVTAKTQMLFTVRPGTWTFYEGAAAQIRLQGVSPQIPLNVTAGYRYRGAEASLLYADDNDGTLGKAGEQQYWINGWWRPVSFLRVGSDNKVIFKNSDMLDNNIAFTVKPFADLDLSRYTGFTSSLSTYIYFRWQTQAEASRRFFVGETGLRFSATSPVPGVIERVDVYFGYNSWDKGLLFNTLIAAFRFPRSINAEIGLGIRTVKPGAPQAVREKNNIFCFSLGVSWRIPSEAVRSPLLYSTFVYNMNPYDEDTNVLDLDASILDSPVSYFNGCARFLVAVKWSF